MPPKGWTRGRAETEQMPREGRRLKAGEYLGRNGQIIRRNKPELAQLDVPAEFREEGWDYVWARQYCINEPDNQNMTATKMGGWTSVTCKQMRGFMNTPEDPDDQAITYGGLVLMERPMAISEDAQNEEREKILAQRRKQGHHEFDLPSGFVRNPKDEFMNRERVSMTAREAEGGEISID